MAPWLSRALWRTRPSTESCKPFCNIIILLNSCHARWPLEDNKKLTGSLSLTALLVKSTRTTRSHSGRRNVRSLGPGWTESKPGMCIVSTKSCPVRFRTARRKQKRKKIINKMNKVSLRIKMMESKLNSKCRSAHRLHGLYLLTIWPSRSLKNGATTWCASRWRSTCSPGCRVWLTMSSRRTRNSSYPTSWSSILMPALASEPEPSRVRRLTGKSCCVNATRPVPKCSN